MASLHQVHNRSRSEVNNFSLTKQSLDEELSKDLLTVIQIVCYAAILVAGSIGNMILIITTALKRNRKTSQYFILNLATVDLLTCMLSIPFDITLLLLGSWPFGPVLCRVVYPLQTLFMAVSVATLLCMALERHRAIIHPLKPKIQGKIILIVITLAWVISIGLVSPYAAALKMKDGECIENWPNNNLIYPKSFTLCVFLLLYMLPLCIISVAYARIGLRLRTQGQKGKYFVGANSQRMSAKIRTRQNVRIAKVFVIVVVAFAVCFMPFQVMWMWNDFGNGQEWKHFNTFLTFANVMVYANSAVNPFIFGAIGRKYKCCKGFCQQRSKAQYCLGNKRLPLYGVHSKPMSKEAGRFCAGTPQSLIDRGINDEMLCSNDTDSVVMEMESSV